MPSNRVRVVYTFWVTIASLCPTSWFNRVDLPAFGAPISATNPQRVAASSLSRPGNSVGGEGGDPGLDRGESGEGECDESPASPSPTARFRERFPLSRGAGGGPCPRCGLFLRGIR